MDAIYTGHDTHERGDESGANGEGWGDVGVRILLLSRKGGDFDLIVV